MEGEFMYTIYGKQDCIYCNMAKQLLEAKGLSYEYTDLASCDDETLFWFKSQNFKTVPQIYKGEDLIGGFDQLAQEKF